MVTPLHNLAFAGSLPANLTIAPDAFTLADMK
jgi:hypothetical protein